MLSKLVEKIEGSSQSHCPRVAVVDSGIDATHQGVGVVRHVHLEDFTSGDTDCAGHGTACAGIIHGKAPGALLYSLAILDETLSAPPSALLAALVWALQQRMDVVNLSLGTTDLTFRDRLADVCAQACRAGVIIVAAEREDGRPSYPAVFPEVIGVAAGTEKERDGYYYRRGESTECVAKGGAQRVCWTSPRYRIASGSSFAAAHITGLAARIRQAHPDAPLKRVREILEADATPPELEWRSPSLPVDSATHTVRDFSWMKKVALFPFSKEMHALVRGSDLLDFHIVGVADPPGKGLVGRDAAEAIGLPPIGVRIQPRLTAALKEADTLILGYVNLLSQITKKDVLSETAKAAIERGLNVFSFVPLAPSLRERAEARGLHIAVPGLSQAEIQQALNSDPHYPPVDVPVLGIFGTSPQQGKFTLQLALRRLLLGQGYTVGQIGTEHHSELFGMDAVFPMGYASNVSLPLESYVPFLDYKMREITQERQPDVILVGSQSGTIPYDVHTHATHSMTSIAFLLGTKPDACILVVNSMDEEAYIQDNIEGIQALGKTPTLALAMSNVKKDLLSMHGRSILSRSRMEPEEVTERLNQLESRFGIPALSILSEDDQQRLVDIVIGHFAKESS